MFVVLLFRYAQTQDKHEGFYLQEIGNRKIAMFAMYAKGHTSMMTYERIQMQLYRPHVGSVPRIEPLKEIQAKYRKVTPSQAESAWNDQYEKSQNLCAHKYWWGTCKNSTAGFECDVS